VIVKHANPCGVALGANALEAYQKAFKTDTTSAFGGIIAINTIIDGQAAEAISQQFLEVLIAPDYTEEALAVFANKKNVRVLKIALPQGGDLAWEKGLNSHDSKRVGSGLLVQTADNHEMQMADLKIVTKKQPTPTQMADLLFAWNVAKFVNSIAAIKAQEAGLSLQGSVVASDAFFPFRDGVDVLADAGASCVIHPGGSMRDEEVIAAADERGLAMVLTGVRHFRH